MRRKSSLRIIRDPGRFPELISTLSTEEQEHLLDLADAALQSANRVRQYHERVTQQVKDTVERFEKNRFEFNRKDAA